MSLSTAACSDSHTALQWDEPISAYAFHEQHTQFSSTVADAEHTLVHTCSWSKLYPTATGCVGCETAAVAFSPAVWDAAAANNRLQDRTGSVKAVKWCCCNFCSNVLPVLLLACSIDDLVSTMIVM